MDILKDEGLCAEGVSTKAETRLLSVIYAVQKCRVLRQRLSLLPVIFIAQKYHGHPVGVEIGTQILIMSIPH